MSTLEGCKLQRIYYTYRDMDSDFTREYVARDRKLEADGKYSWTGKCEDGYISGPGELTAELDFGAAYGNGGGKTNATYFIVAKPGQPAKYYAHLKRDKQGKISVSGGIQWQLIGTIGPHDRIHNSISDAECADTRDCRALRDALFAMLDADERGKVVAASNSGAEADRVRVVGEIERDKIAKQESEAEMREIERANRAQKDKWLAAQARNDNSSGTLSALGAIAQVAGAAGGKNSSQLNALGAAMQGGTGFDEGRGAASNGSRGLDLGSNVQYSQAVRCVGVAPAKTSSRDGYLVNSCSFTVYTRYCIDSPKRGNGSSGVSCRDHLTGEIYLKPNDPQYVAAGESIDAHTLNAISCKVPFVVPVDLITWNGTKFDGQCVHSSKYGTDPNRGW